jgi:lipopolysaccharide transport system ATP-binding protein
MGKMDEVARRGRTVLFVSHNMGAISHLCQRGIVMDRGQIAFDGHAKKAIETYNLTVFKTTANSELPLSHIIYDATKDQLARQEFAIKRIEIFDPDGNPKALLSTGDSVAFRITYLASRQIPRGSVEIQMTGYDGSRLLYLAMDPDSGFSMSIQPGEHTVECVIKKAPFAAGELLIGAGLVIPWVQNGHLFWRTDLCRINVVAHDEYNSGFSLHADRSLIVTDHFWRLLS